jgi:hypothetical protein
VWRRVFPAGGLLRESREREDEGDTHDAVYKSGAPQVPGSSCPKLKSGPKRLRDIRPALGCCAQGAGGVLRRRLCRDGSGRRFRGHNQ